MRFGEINVLFWLELGSSTKADRDVDVVEKSELKVPNKMLPRVVSVLV